MELTTRSRADSTIRRINSTYGMPTAVASIGRSECEGCRPASGLASMKCGTPRAIGPEVEAAGITAPQRAPGGQRRLLRPCRTSGSSRPHQPVLDQLFTTLLVDIRVHVRLRVAQQNDLQRAQHGGAWNPCPTTRP